MSASLTWSKIDILRKYGAPFKFTTAVETIYRNNTCVQKITNKIREIPRTVGVQQVDNMAPVLFLFLITAFTKTLEIVWKERDIPILCVMTTVNEHIVEGKICSHTPAMFKSKKLTAYEILQCLYVDDGAFPFGTREDLQRRIELIFHHFARFGLEIHIGCGALESKTECVFPPPPQFFQRLEKTNVVACTIQQASRRAQRAHTVACIVAQHTPQDQVPTIPVLSLSPSTASFPIGCRVIVASSHPQHVNTYGAVIRHIAKFVIFAPENCSRGESIRILPTLLILVPSLATPSPPSRQDEARTQDHIAFSDGAEEDQTCTQGQREQDNISFDALPETANFSFHDGYISITCTFRYLGSLIKYSLRNDDDITARIASAMAAMGALKEVWRNPHLDAYNKYLLFRAIPMNLLLWGDKTWSLRKSQLDQL